jgi:hypothetical protein
METKKSPKFVIARSSLAQIKMKNLNDEAISSNLIRNPEKEIAASQEFLNQSVHFRLLAMTDYDYRSFDLWNLIS